MVFRIASVSFLNARPLIDRFAPADRPRVEVRRALPSRLAGLLENGEADVALMPVVEVFRGRAGGILPGVAIGCDGPVDSVKLFHDGNLGDLERVATDRGSRSSVALLKILLAEIHGVRPEFHEIEPTSDLTLDPGEGALIIGDRCLEFERDRKDDPAGPRAWDLGAAWRDLTGLPFVFAAWSVAPGLPERLGPAGIADLAGILARARDRGLADLAAIVADAAAAGHPGRGGEATREALDYYFRQSLRYELGDRELAGLRRYHELCVEHGIVPAGIAPIILKGPA